MLTYRATMDQKNVWHIKTLQWPLLGVLPAFLLGVGIMRAYGAPWSMPLMNLAAVLVGLLGLVFGASGLTRWTSKRPEIIASLLLALGAASLFGADLNGVFRWVRLGPLRLHPMAIITPLLLLTLVWLWEKRETAWTLVLIGMALALFVVQPDAGQATAFAAGVAVLAIRPDKRRLPRFVMVVLAALGAFLAWRQPDPLAGVEMVEHILGHAFAMQVGLGIVAVLALGMLPGSALIHSVKFSTNSVARTYGFSLMAYFTASILVVMWGEFPMPVLGFGASPILGALVGLGLLARIER
jgi:cell division protein FtsW (lipid II flippase)